MRWRRVGYAALAAAAVTAPLWGPAVLRPMAFFAVRHVEVEGVRYLAPESVVVRMVLGPAASVFDDLGAVEERLRGMGGIQEAQVGRRVPGTLRVRIREIEPVALADGPEGLVAVGSDGRPLPFALAGSVLDVPVVPSADRRLLEALAAVQATDLALYGAVASATLRGGEVVLELNEGRLRLPVPVEPALVRRVSAVRSDLAGRSIAWRELDGRFRGWIVVRRAPAPSAGGAA